MGRVTGTVEREVQPLRRSRLELIRVGWLLAAYAGIRVVGLLVLHAGVHADQPPPDNPFDSSEPAEPSTYDELGAWDGGWYVKLAEHGYPDHLSLVSPREDSTAPLVFPPLYPMAMRLLHLMGMPALTAGLLITAVAGALAVVGVYAVARDLIAPRAAMLAALLWAAGPMTVVLSMAYSEALFVALAAWAMWLARRGWWLTAGLLALLSGLTRSTGLAVGAAIAMAALLAWRRGGTAPEPGPSTDDTPSPRPFADAPHPRPRTEAPHPRPRVEASRWRIATAVVLAAAGVPSWWLYVAIVGGRIDAWFAAQQLYWGSRFDFGASVLQNAWRTLSFDGLLDAVGRVVQAASLLAMLAAVLLLAALLAHAWRARGPRARAWWPAAAYAVVLVALAAGSAGYEASKVRFLVPMFTLLLLPARSLATAGRTAQVGVVGVAALMSAWFGAFMLTVWPYAI